jgi:nucleoside 2-deoxyribosyltransferase
MKKIVVAATLSILMMFSFTSCEVFRELVDDKVVTTLDNVTPEGVELVVPVDLNTLPEDVREMLKETGKRLVLVDKDYVKAPEKAIDIEDADTGTVIETGLAVANTIWPGIAALEGLGLLFSRRKRKHYGEAVKKALPANGKMELGEAIVSLVRGLGMAHSSEKTKDTFEEETKKVA